MEQIEKAAEKLEEHFEECFDNATKATGGGYEADYTDKWNFYRAFKPFIEEYRLAGATEERERAKGLVEAANNILHLHLCEEEGLSSGRPTPIQWMEAVDKLSEALNQYK
jgi:hypothetical protein